MVVIISWPTRWMNKHLTAIAILMTPPLQYIVSVTAKKYQLSHPSCKIHSINSMLVNTNFIMNKRSHYHYHYLPTCNWWYLRAASSHIALTCISVASLGPPPLLASPPPPTFRPIHPRGHRLDYCLVWTVKYSMKFSTSVNHNSWHLNAALSHIILTCTYMA